MQLNCISLIFLMFLTAVSLPPLNCTGWVIKAWLSSHCPLMQFALAADVDVTWWLERGIALFMSGGLLRVHRHYWYPYFAPVCPATPCPVSHRA